MSKKNDNWKILSKRSATETMRNRDVFGTQQLERSKIEEKQRPTSRIVFSLIVALFAVALVYAVACGIDMLMANLYYSENHCDYYVQKSEYQTVVGDDGLQYELPEPGIGINGEHVSLGLTQDGNPIASGANMLNGKRTDKSWAKKEEETKNILMAKGIPENKQYLLESISQNENRTNYLNKKKKREIKGNDLFTTEAYYRAYKKRSKVLPFDKDLYNDEMENGINKNKIQNDIKKELLGNDMKQQIEKRSKFSRRRPVIDEDEVDYINERNQKYNQKLKRFFGKESKEVKNNMERRTAL